MRVIAIIGVAAGLAVGGAASADDRAPFVPSSSWPPTTSVPPEANPIDPGAGPPGTHPMPGTGLLDLSVGLPIRSRVDVAPVQTKGESIAFDASALLHVTGGLYVGATAGVVRWRNDFTAIYGGSEYLARGGAIVRYALVRTGFRPFVQAALGIGVSDLRPSFSIFEPASDRGIGQSTMVDHQLGAAYFYELGAGCSRRFSDRWAILFEVDEQRDTMDHHVVFRDGNGVTSSTPDVSLGELDLRAAIELAY